MKHSRKALDHLRQRKDEHKDLLLTCSTLIAQNEIHLFQKKELGKEVVALKRQCSDREKLLDENILLENKVEDLKKEIGNLEDQLSKWE